MWLLKMNLFVYVFIYFYIIKYILSKLKKNYFKKS